MEIQEDLELCWLAKMKNPSHKRDQQKYCEFHADHSYETKECVVLRLQIEKLINNGKLTRFLGDQRQQVPQGERNPPRNRGGRGNE